MKGKSKRFWMYWLITLLLTGLYFLVGWIILDYYESTQFITYSVIALAITGLIRWTIFEFWWRKIK